ncbi:TPA: carboxymuconolactone decarboxylase family protein [Klebsiella aerogenes]|uniref:Carboxymuconolactone decarboxylase family protein n=1 Tax=Klebsiella aerogenes TaxID=548 RepID=A0AAP9QYU7_KLEAE|nr:carboxymuconolactone decarboxylase family protein [Klebsiella aerogenes]EIV2082943.1 carboxymuconolactone decarboxylase family protein [Klebsiella aerogenes]EIW9211184.1 carboxymuconolactone decarboxylase family protein [Klebsiella aerogenes]EKU4514950.1 carboxymuconolactone decarboxylase family protein [Klebsiella aerogenes]EKU6670889.1 carboxymuconolactone decarboxylase family protein [Klebsiella aerogenes]EKU7553156.1 carboxymuconolactone decarboxylase family protein [Klebsiella aerogene
MTTLRQPYSELSPEIYKGLVQASIALEKSELGSTMVELVYLRVSQINGCAFCLEMHSKALRKAGVDQSKLDALAGWRVSAHFSAAERAALAWAESVTDIAASHAEDEVYLPLLEHFTPRQISDLTFAISLMNAFNRLAVAMRM